MKYDISALITLRHISTCCKNGSNGSKKLITGKCSEINFLAAKAVFVHYFFSSCKANHNSILV